MCDADLAIQQAGEVGIKEYLNEDRRCAHCNNERLLDDRLPYVVNTRFRRSLRSTVIRENKVGRSRRHNN
jgi:hypothetical protein